MSKYKSDKGTQRDFAVTPIYILRSVFFFIIFFFYFFHIRACVPARVRVVCVQLQQGSWSKRGAQIINNITER